MFEAYAVAVRVRLIDGVATGLLGMSRQFHKVHGDAKAFQKTLDKIKLTMMAGGALATTGGIGLGLIWKTLPAAKEYAHQLNIMNMAGLKHQEVAEAVAASWKNTGTVITTTATENMRAILDLRNVLGSMDEAKWALPIVTKIGAAMAASSEGNVKNNAQDIAFSMAKALDIIGAARNPVEFEKQATAMSKVVTAFQNRVTPRQFQSVFQYARQAKFDLSDEFKYEFLPSLMLEMSGSNGSAGGGSRGVGPMLAAIYRVTNQGYVSKKAIPTLEKLGLLQNHNFVKTTTSGTVGVEIKGHELAAQNPFLWNQQVLVPAIRKMLGPKASDQAVRGVINQVFAGNQLAASAMAEFYSKPSNFLRDQKIIRGAMPFQQAYATAIKNDPDTQMVALKAQWKNVQTGLGLVVLPLLISGTIKLTGVLHGLSNWMQAHPNLTKGLVIGFTALAGAMAFGGTVILLSAGFSAMAALIGPIGVGIGILGGAFAIIASPIGIVVAGVAALGVACLVIVKNWDKIKGAFDWIIKHVPGIKSDKDAAAPNGKADPLSAYRYHRAPGEKEYNLYQKQSYAPPASTAGQRQGEGHVYMDGKKVGKIITAYQTREMNAASRRAPSAYDPSMMLTPVSASQA